MRRALIVLAASQAQQLQNRLPLGLGFISDSSRLPKKYGGLIVGAQRVLSLHGIGAPHHGVTEDERFYWLGREAFVGLLQTIVVTREGSDLPVVITFDDGNQSDASIALPELVKRNLKAIFFVVGGRIGLPHYLDRGWRLETLSRQAWRSDHTVCIILTGADLSRR